MRTTQLLLIAVGICNVLATATPNYSGLLHPRYVGCTEQTCSPGRDGDEVCQQLHADEGGCGSCSNTTKKCMGILGPPQKKGGKDTDKKGGNANGNGVAANGNGVAANGNGAYSTKKPASAATATNKAPPLSSAATKKEPPPSAAATKKAPPPTATAKGRKPPTA